MNTKEIRARLEAATDGPWEIGTDKEDLLPGFRYDILSEDEWHVASIAGGADSKELPDGEEEKANADFIANAPTDIKDLLDEVEAKQHIVDELHSRLAELTSYVKAMLGDKNFNFNYMDSAVLQRFERSVEKNKPFVVNVWRAGQSRPLNKENNNGKEEDTDILA